MIIKELHRGKIYYTDLLTPIEPNMNYLRPENYLSIIDEITTKSYNVSKIGNIIHQSKDYNFQLIDDFINRFFLDENFNLYVSSKDRISFRYYRKGIHQHKESKTFHKAIQSNTSALYKTEDPSAKGSYIIPSIINATSIEEKFIHLKSILSKY